MNRSILLMSCALSVLAASGGGALAASNDAKSAAEGTTLGEVVVTAQRRQENLQDTPVAVSAFSQDTLKSKGLNGGQDLLLQVPNANYTRTNFGGYDFSIRGVGTNTIGAGAQAGVSINENELPVTANNFADTNFYDVQRVEVVRGPQGTLYGRSATGGAVDVITNKPTDTWGGYATASYGNYNTLNASGALNIPLGDAFALRIAGMREISDGFGENTYLNERVDGRNLGSIRATLRFKPNDRFNAYLLYENYTEDDTRNRVGKQLCITDPGPSSVGGVPIAAAGGNVLTNYAAFLNQGCLPGSLYQPAAYGAVNSNATFLATGNLIGLNNGTNVFANNPLQDSNLHNIQSVIQPEYKINTALVELHMEYKLTDNLTLTSISGFNRNGTFTVEDYNRIVPSAPFTPANALFGPYSLYAFPNGVVPDPQVGTSNYFRTFDQASGSGREYTEELRLASSFSGKLNFSGGLFYSENRGNTDYYVESNALTAAAYANNFAGGALAGGPVNVDPNASPDGSGHNYYDSRTGGGSYLKSYAAFGEVYYNIKSDLKLTLGGRFTEDVLYNLAYPISVIIGANNGTTPYPNTNVNPLLPNGGYGGFPTTVCASSVTATQVNCLVQQRVTYNEFTGRANLDWTPTLSFTDKTLVYATFSRGYKGGGFNTPCQGGGIGNTSGVCPYPATFAPEFINAYEIGTKNTLLGGRMTLNLDGFYYDYTGYQISTIVDKSSVNLNLNAKIYGVEFETAYSPVHDLTLNANLGYLHSQIDDGQTQVDQINLTQGNSNYTLLHADDGTACLAPTAYLAYLISQGAPAPFLSSGQIPGIGQAFAGACTVQGYAAANAYFGSNVNYANVNGVPADLGGKHLPNTPELTVSLGGQYIVHLPKSWDAIARVDYYWQAHSYARIFNAVNDYLQAYDVVNATVTFRNMDQGFDVQFFIKNAFNAQPITGVYLTNDTSGLFQNVFTLEPRTFGLQLTKKF